MFSTKTKDKELFTSSAHQTEGENFMKNKLWGQPSKITGTLAVTALSLFVVSCGENMENKDAMSVASNLGDRSAHSKTLFVARDASSSLYLTSQPNQKINLELVTENFADTDSLVFSAGEGKPVLSESFDPSGYRLYYEDANEYSELWTVNLIPIKDRFLPNTRKMITIRAVDKDNTTIQKIDNNNLVSRVGGGEDLMLNIPVEILGVDTNMPCNMRISRIGKVCGDTNTPIAVVYGFDKNSDDDKITKEVVTDLLYGRLRDTDAPNTPYFTKSVIQLTEDRKMTFDVAEMDSKGVAICLTGFELDGATRIRGQVTTRDSGTSGKVWLSWHVDSENK